VDRRALRRNRKALGASRSPPEVGWSLISETTQRREKPSALHRALPRCVWASREPLLSYHDREWGTPLHDDRRLFEFLVLEGMQAGLSWETVLRKRSAFRRAFVRFDPVKVSRFGARDVARLMRDESIIRNRGKLE